MKAKDLVAYLEDLIKKADNLDEIEVFNESSGLNIDYVRLTVKIDSNGIAVEEIQLN